MNETLNCIDIPDLSKAGSFKIKLEDEKNPSYKDPCI